MDRGGLRFKCPHHEWWTNCFLGLLLVFCLKGLGELTTTVTKWSQVVAWSWMFSDARHQMTPCWVGSQIVHIGRLSSQPCKRHVKPILLYICCTKQNQRLRKSRGNQIIDCKNRSTRGGTWTRTTVRSQDFKSWASANSATRAWVAWSWIESIKIVFLVHFAKRWHHLSLIVQNAEVPLDRKAMKSTIVLYCRTQP